MAKRDVETKRRLRTVEGLHSRDYLSAQSAIHFRIDGATLLAREVHSIIGERLDMLVSNAGISKALTIKDYTVEDFDNLCATNVRSPFFLVQQLMPVIGEGPNIIVISSIGARAVAG
jgi:3-oxoacyl-[acyl-carrier protein] reductase